MKRLRTPWGRLRQPSTAAPDARAFAESGGSAPANARRNRHARAWATAGAALGLLVGAVAFVPAAAVAWAVAQSTHGRVLLADARGSLWQGSALLVLTDGPGSRDAASLPGRLHWTVSPRGRHLQVQARHDCCLQEPATLQVEPGLGRIALRLPAAERGLGQWPAAWLSGLGTPFNTLQLGGTLRLASTGATMEVVQGRLRLDGTITLDLESLSSRVSVLNPLGSYRVRIHGGSQGDTTGLDLSTTSGALRLSGTGQWAGSGLRFRGEAVAAEGFAPALNNLLNIIGRRDGARSLISIG